MSIVDQIFTVLRDHCTKGDEGRSLFLKKVSDIVEGSTLRTRDQDEFWAASWEKPFYSGTKSAGATIAVERAKAAGMFQDYRELHSPTWDVKLKRSRAVEARGARVQELIDQGVLTGMCRVGFRLAAAVGLARCLDEMQRLNNQVVSIALDGDASTFANVREKARPLDAALVSVSGIGRTTALHIMTDLGYPVVKTDIWVCRFSSTFPGVRDAVLKNHGIDLALADEKVLERKLNKCEPEIFKLFDQLVSEHSGQPVGITPNLDLMFRRYRFVDLIVAKFGMGEEASFGLHRSGVDALLEDDSLRQKYPELAEKAEALSRSPKKPRDQRSKKH